MVSFTASFTEVRIYVSTTYRVRVVYTFTLVPRVLRFNSPVFVLPFLKPFYAVPLSIGPKNNDDSSLMQLNADLGFEGMKEEMANFQKCGAGKVIGQAEVDALKKKNPGMR